MLLPDLDLDVTKGEEIINSYSRYVLRISNSKIAVVAYGSKKEGFNVLFVENVSNKYLIWDGYLGTPEQAAEYIRTNVDQKK